MSRDNDRPEAWMDDAECTQYPPDMWFPNIGDKHTADKANGICDGCPVKMQCLEYAMRHGFDEGIFGGMNGRARQVLRQKSGVRQAVTDAERAERVARIEELNRQGVSDERIAQVVGVNPSSVSRIRRDLGLPVVGRAGRPKKETAA